MGLLGEYIGRIYHDVRGRPRYFVPHILGRRHIATIRSKIVSAPDGWISYESAEQIQGRA